MNANGKFFLYHSSCLAVAVGLLLMAAGPVNAQVSFEALAPGEASTMNLWGFGWIGNTERNITRAGGEQNIDVVRIGSTKEWALDSNNNLHPDAIAEIDKQIAVAVRVQQGNPNVRWSMVSSGGNGINPYYIQNNGVDIRGANWLEMFRATKDYVETNYNMDLAYVEVANEQDFGGKIGTKSNIHSIQERFQADPDFANIPLVGPSTLDSRNALNWYEPAQSSTDWGATHLINGSGSSYVNFVDRVINQDGKEYFGSEVHHLVEMIVAEEYGGIGGLWWNNLSEIQGLFIQATEGEVLFYREKAGSTSAAIGYRDVDDPNLIHIFAASAVNGDGGATFQFQSTDVPLLWNGGSTPQNSFTITIGATEERYLQARIASVPEPSVFGFAGLSLCLIGLKRRRAS